MSIHKLCSWANFRICTVRSYGTLAFMVIKASHAEYDFQQTTFWNSFLIFPPKKDLTFPANCLLCKQLAWNVKSCFLGKIRKYQFNVSSAEFALISSQSRLWLFMQTVSLIGDNLHEKSILFPRKNKKNIINVSSAEFANRAVSVKALSFIRNCVFHTILSIMPLFWL